MDDQTDMTVLKRIKLDHDYCLPPPEELRLRLDDHINLVHRLQNKNKNMCRKIDRLCRKVSKLPEAISDLESSTLISEKASDLLTGFAVTSVAGEMFQR